MKTSPRAPRARTHSLSMLALLSATALLPVACEHDDGDGAGEETAPVSTPRGGASNEQDPSAAPAAQTAQAAPAAGNRQVLEYHNSPTRDGLFVDGAFTRAAAARLKRDTRFSARVNGPTYAQPLYFEGGPGGKDLLIVATEQNEVSAFDAASGAVVWRKVLASPAPRSALPCGNISTLGVTGTPVIDAASRTLLVAAMVNEGGAKHKIFALSLDDGAVKPGWPVDVASKARANGFTFESRVQNQRGALLVLNGSVYVPYGGHFGDCGNYHGWVVGVSLTDPSKVSAWSTRAKAGGLWSPGGIASDGKSLYVVTGNTMAPNGGLFSAPTTYGDGESVIRLPPSLQFSTQPADFAAAMNWSALDRSDQDVGGSGPLLFNVAGGTPSTLGMAIGKDGNAYLLNSQNLGGMGRFLSAKRVSTENVITAPAAYTTPSGTFVAFKGAGASPCSGTQRKITALKVTAGSPPQVNVAWCAGPAGQGSPIVTTTGNNAETIVWYVAAEGDNKLRGFNGETGAVVFDGGGASDAMARVTRFQTPIVAKGRIYVASNTDVYAFSIDGTTGGPGGATGSTGTPARDAGAPTTPTTGATANACAATYASFGQAFFRNYCTSCHGATLQLGSQRFDSLEAVSASADNIVALAGNATDNRMPPASSRQPTAAERAQLGAWLETCK